MAPPASPLPVRAVWAAVEDGGGVMDSHLRSPSSMSWSTYDEQFVATFDGPEDAVERLRAIQVPEGEWPPIVMFAWSDNGPFLGVSVGEEAVLTYDTSLDPPYYVSVGDPHAPGLTCVIYGRQESEFERRALVPSTTAETAIRMFLSSRERPDVLEWEDV